MKCRYHPQEQIKCINIDHQSKAKRLLCFECYVDHVKQELPCNTIYKITKVCNLSQQIIEDPKILFSLQNRGYKEIQIIQDFHSRRKNIEDELGRIKDSIILEVAIYFKQIDSYKKKLDSFYNNVSRLYESSFQYIGYNQFEQDMKNIVGPQEIGKSSTSKIIKNINAVFVKLNQDHNIQFRDGFEKIKTQFHEILDLKIIKNWKSYYKSQKHISTKLKKYHEDLFGVKLIDCSKRRLKERIKKTNQKMLLLNTPCCICRTKSKSYASSPNNELVYCCNCQDQIFYINNNILDPVKYNNF